MGHWDEDRGPDAVDRKTAQLCKQVERALVGVLAESRDEKVRELVVASVEPIAGAGQLRAIVLAPTASFEALQPYRDGLDRIHGYVRTEIAQFVNRKRAPEMTFVVLPGSAPRG